MKFFTNFKLIHKPLFISSVEVFDKDKLGKDKSLGKIEVNPSDLNNEAKWYPLQVYTSKKLIIIFAPFSEEISLILLKQVKILKFYKLTRC